MVVIGLTDLPKSGGTMAPPDFGRSVNPISQPGGRDYALLITAGTPGFFTPPDGPAGAAQVFM